ncbi:flagellar biosynthesis protein [Pseudomonas sp. NFACC16-2]|nr:flagellar biosynthesis protein [Pseudomonas sp. NFACC16-2]
MQLAHQLRLGLGQFVSTGVRDDAELVKLLARMELGDSIPEELYRTIAEIIAFAWNLKGKFPQGYDPNAPSVEKDVTDRGDDY